MLLLRFIRTLLDNPPSMASVLLGLFMLSGAWVVTASPITRALAQIAPPWAWGSGGVVFGLLARWPRRGRGWIVVAGANLGMCLAWSYIAWVGATTHPAAPAMPLYVLLGVQAFEQIFASLGITAVGFRRLDTVIRERLRRIRGGL